jgi:23S rRNA pseudouridine1911/1915/1917 synthase
MNKIKILYEDEDILAIDKPSGILVHPDGRKDPSTKLRASKTIFDLFLKKYPKLEIVHRLDKETSGVLLLAKNQKAHEFLKSQFVNREVKKTYNAIVSGWVKNDHGIINKPIGRSPSDFRRRLAGRGARGELREAITEYKVLKKFTSPRPSPYQGEGEKFTFLEVKPKTGRTHQIRVHMKFLNYPIMCDSLYNPKGFCPTKLGRLALHAKSIEFKNLKGETIKVESPLPKDIESMIK